MKKIMEKGIGISVFGFLIIFLVKLFSFLGILKYFPLNNYHDLALKLPELYLLANYGFHTVIPHWYNGFRLFEIYPPGWYFFSLPIYWITNNLELTTLISLILMLGLGFFASFLIFKKTIHRIAFFVLFFMNPIMIDYVFFIGRFPEFFAWVVYLFVFYLVFKYKKKVLDAKGIVFLIISSSIVIISHQYVAILAMVLVSLLFLIKSNKERIMIGFSLLCSLLVTSFFWIDFLRVLINNPYAVNPTLYQKGSLLGLHSLISFNTFVLAGWFLLFYFYKKQFTKKDKLFFYPLLGLSVLIITRIITLIPFFSEVPPNAYNLFFISLSLFLLFKIKFSENMKKIVGLSFILVLFLSFILIFQIRPERNLEYTPEQIEIMDLFSKIDGNYVLIKDNKLNDMNPLIAIATINELHTPLGLYSAQLPKELQEKFKIFNLDMCKNVLDVKNIIAYKNSCENLKKCDFQLEFEGDHSCLFIV